VSKVILEGKCDGAYDGSLLWVKEGASLRGSDRSALGSPREDRLGVREVLSEGKSNGAYDGNLLWVAEGASLRDSNGSLLWVAEGV